MCLLQAYLKGENSNNTAWTQGWTIITADEKQAIPLIRTSTGMRQEMFLTNFKPIWVCKTLCSLLNWISNRSLGIILNTTCKMCEIVRKSKTKR